MTDEYIMELVRRLNRGAKHKVMLEAAAVILLLHEQLRIAEAVTENSKRAHEILVATEDK